MTESNPPTEKEIAYFAMIEYLDHYWKRGKSDEVAGMLGGMQFTTDGFTMDQACWSDWEQAYDRAKAKTKLDYHWSRP